MEDYAWVRHGGYSGWRCIEEDLPAITAKDSELPLLMAFIS
jgi:hypothetical protein